MGKQVKNSEHSLVNSLKKGNYLAFNQLFDNYSKRLFLFALSLLKSDIDAEEVVQDVFLKVWEKRKNLNADLSFKSYLFTIASNCIKAQFNKKLKENNYRHELLNELFLFEQDTNNQIDYKTLLSKVEKLIEEMPPRRKEIFLKRKKEELPVKQIAFELNISEKTVENHISQSIKYLKKNLKKEGLTGLLYFSLFL
ncbi:MAG: RNA polymerase sigma-70 factor [Prolixibacteraceae bacterium]|nr:RNA polymerase sigma-70 factor [Prolixibacteraceae bacterium]MBN2774055.1 RNA polymerase sigma-70 factor [Prolixibacteraceae bacterium]